LSAGELEDRVILAIGSSGDRERGSGGEPGWRGEPPAAGAKRPMTGPSSLAVWSAATGTTGT